MIILQILILWTVVSVAYWFMTGEDEEAKINPWIDDILLLPVAAIMWAVVAIVEFVNR